jgi:ABC-2 type transport system permease protein
MASRADYQLSKVGGCMSRMERLSRETDLLIALVQRELKARYRGSYLGWAWALARPLIMLLIYGVVIGVFLGAAKSIPEFMIFIFVGLMAWSLFSTLVTSSINSVMQAAPLVTKHKFRVILVPLSSAVVALVDFAIQFLVLLIGYALVRDVPAVTALPYLISSFFGVALLGIGLGLLLSAWNVFVRDVSHLTDVALQVGFWLCPIVYSYGFVERAAAENGLSVEWVTRIYMLNPMANGVLGFQRALWPPASTTDGALLSFPGQLELRLLILLAFAAILATVGALAFSRLSYRFAEEL